MNWYKKYSSLWDDIKNKTRKNNNWDYQQREEFVKNYSWAIPSEKAVQKIKDFAGGQTILEVGAGLGLWAKLLKDSGVSIVPTDLSLKNDYVAKKDPYINVEEIGHLEAIQKYGHHKILMMIWPPYDHPMANETLKAFKGKKIIFVGEGRGGCTGCDNFFKELEKNWVETDYIAIPNWLGMHDSLMFFVRK